LFSAFAGITVAVSFSLLPTVKVRVFLFNVTPVTDTPVFPDESSEEHEPTHKNGTTNKSKNNFFIFVSL
jgi:hypothetical protein